MIQARKRFENDLLLKKQRDLEADKDARDLEQENDQYEQATNMRKKQEQNSYNEILQEQVKLSQLRRVLEKQYSTEDANTTFGVQQDSDMIKKMLENKVYQQSELNNDLQKQIAGNLDKKFELLEAEKLGDAVNTNKAKTHINKERLQSREKHSN